MQVTGIRVLLLFKKRRIIAWQKALPVSCMLRAGIPREKRLSYRNQEERRFISREKNF
jgi:hypothetical protein